MSNSFLQLFYNNSFFIGFTKYIKTNIIRKYRTANVEYVGIPPSVGETHCCCYFLCFPDYGKLCSCSFQLQEV